MNRKHIHFIGICGVAMSAIAIAFKKQGWTVTGSDVGFYPPISTHLKDADVDFYPGWHPERMGTPDLVVVGNVAGSQNPEWLYVQTKKIKYCSYPEVIAEYFVKKNSIVVAGTYGKTTSTALVTWIMCDAGLDPSYMFGGLGLNGLESAHMSDPSAALGVEYSILEGDEYKASRTDNGPKFAYYSPTHLLLTSVVWDHADVYPTEESYIKVFQKLVESIPLNGLKVVSEKVTTVILNPKGEESLSQSPNGERSFANAQDDNFVTYGKNNTNDYVYGNIAQTKNGLTFTIAHEQKMYSIKSSCLGEYMADNITGCFALLDQMHVPTEKIISAVATFKGMKRRLEKRFEAPPAGGVTIFDDIAHSPSKATAILETLKAVYPGKLIAVFEPNTGNRRPQAVAWYDHAFAAADEVIIPRLTKIKTDPNETPPFDGTDIAHLIAKTHKKVEYTDDDKILLNTLHARLTPGSTVVFLGSHGFRGMIEDLIKFYGQSASTR